MAIRDFTRAANFDLIDFRFLRALRGVKNISGSTFKVIRASPRDGFGAGILGIKEKTARDVHEATQLF